MVFFLEDCFRNAFETTKQKSARFFNIKEFTKKTLERTLPLIETWWNMKVAPCSICKICTMSRFLVVEPTHLKNMLVKLDHETPNRDEHKTYFQPPPSFPKESIVQVPKSCQFQGLMFEILALQNHPSCQGFSCPWNEKLFRPWKWDVWKRTLTFGVYVTNFKGLELLNFGGVICYHRREIFQALWLPKKKP